MEKPVYISAQKHEELLEELAKRKGEMRQTISKKIEVAKDQGDLSENFEYQSAKEEQAANEGAIFRLEEMLKNIVIVETKKGASSISIGTTFRVRLPNGSETTFELVGAQETNPLEGKISNESPIGNAFLGKEVGEDVQIETPAGSVSYTILSIE